MIYIDKLQSYDQKANTKQGQKYFGEGKLSCHLTADTDEELHAFAQRIGLKRVWFQDHYSHPHYDMVPGKRALALALIVREKIPFTEGIAPRRH